ncbi:hypothetical protein WK13_35000 [Burkholderia ubonensis]|nr:hypothetical protein WK13_35000 [Burkholderia ubonensis]
MLSYVDIMDGDIIAGLILSHICYWAKPNPKTGKSKLTIWRDGKLWLAKSRPEWMEECRVTDMMLRRVLPKIKEKGLIDTELFKHGGSPKVHIWLNVERLTELEHEVGFSLPLKQQSPFGSNNGMDSGGSTQTLLRSSNTMDTDNGYIQGEASASDAGAKAPFQDEYTLPLFQEGGELDSSEKEENGTEMKMGKTAAEIQAALATKKAAPATAGLKGKAGLALLWKKRMTVLYPTGYKELTTKESGQMNQLFVKLLAAKADPILVLDWVLQNWDKYAYDVKLKKGEKSAPLQPVIGFVLSHYDVALQLIASAAENQAKTPIDAVPKMFDKPGQVEYSSNIVPNQAKESPVIEDDDKPVTQDMILETLKKLQTGG